MKLFLLFGPCYFHYFYLTICVPIKIMPFRYGISSKLSMHTVGLFFESTFLSPYLSQTTKETYISPSTNSGSRNLIKVSNCFICLSKYWTKNMIAEWRQRPTIKFQTLLKQYWSHGNILMFTIQGNKILFLQKLDIFCTPLRSRVNFTNSLKQSANAPAHIIWRKKMPFSFINKTAHNTTGAKNLKLRTTFMMMSMLLYSSKFSINLLAQKLFFKMMVKLTTKWEEKMLLETLFCFLDLKNKILAICKPNLLHEIQASKCRNQIFQKNYFHKRKDIKLKADLPHMCLLHCFVFLKKLL